MAHRVHIIIIALFAVGCGSRPGDELQQSAQSLQLRAGFPGLHELVRLTTINKHSSPFIGVVRITAAEEGVALPAGVLDFIKGSPRAIVRGRRLRFDTIRTIIGTAPPALVETGTCRKVVFPNGRETDYARNCSSSPQTNERTQPGQLRLVFASGRHDPSFLVGASEFRSLLVVPLATNGSLQVVTDDYTTIASAEEVEQQIRGLLSAGD